MEKLEKKGCNVYSLLWNQYEKLHVAMQQKTTYFEAKKKLFKDLLTEYTKFTDIMIKHFESENKQKCPKGLSQYQEIFDIFTTYSKNTLNNHKDIFESIHQKISSILNNYEKEKLLYSYFKEYLPKYNSDKEKYLKLKEKYHKSALQSEKALLKFNKENIQKNKEVAIPKKLFKDTLDNLKKYQISLENANNKRKNSIELQRKLIKYYVSINKAELKIYYQILDDFLKIERKKSIEYFYTPEVNNIITINNQRNINHQLFEKLSEFKGNEKPDKEFQFEQYKSNIDFDKCKENEEFKINVETVKMIKSKLDNAFNDFTVEKEENKKNMRELLEKLFNSKEEITDIDKNTFINYLDDNATHHLFLVVLSKLRINNDFKKDKKIIELLSESISKILENAEIYSDFGSAKNCLILSQTFYYEEEGKKIYIFEYIKNNRWLNSVDFWRTFIMKMIAEEIKKFSELHYKDENYINLDQKNENLPEKMNKRISDILFSQLITYITNMNEFNIEKKYIVQIVDEFTEKYNYLSKEQTQGILSTVSPDKEEIEKLRTEYEAENCELFLSKSSDNLFTKFGNEINNENEKIGLEKRKSANTISMKGLKSLNHDNNNTDANGNKKAVNSSDSLGLTKDNTNNVNGNRDIEKDKKDIIIEESSDSNINSKSNTLNEEEDKE